MIPRMVFDLDWSDLVAGARASLLARHRDRSAADAERAFGGDATRNLAMLSVRSGFSALLSALQLPPGSRIAFSGVTIRDMPRIAQHHGVQVDAFDLDPHTLAPDLDSLRRTLTPQTKAIVVAHLFGARTDLSAARALADERGILLLEDCAQAWTGDGWRGHPESDVAFFSFGPIKTATALGGAILRFRSPDLRARVAQVQAAWPTQRQAKFAQRVAKFGVLSALSLRPVFTAFTKTCDLLGKDWDALIAQSARGFQGDDFFGRIHTRPCAALLALLTRRLRQPHGPRLAARAAAAGTLLRGLSGSHPANAPNAAHAAPELGASAARAPGALAAAHSHWVVPIAFDNPQQAAATLRSHGFDATRGTSSMTVIGDAPAREAPRAHEAEKRWLYVPCHRRMNQRDLARLGKAIECACHGSALQPRPSMPAATPKAAPATAPISRQ